LAILFAALAANAGAATHFDVIIKTRALILAADDTVTVQIRKDTA
jgi:hypothetical protein